MAEIGSPRVSASRAISAVMLRAIGFTAGAAILIATSQLKHFFGVSIPAGESFLHTWQDLFKQFHDINLYVTLVAAVTLAVVVTLAGWVMCRG